jgi:hypothetical protein
MSSNQLGLDSVVMMKDMSSFSEGGFHMTQVHRRHDISDKVWALVRSRIYLDRKVVGAV